MVKPQNRYKRTRPMAMALAISAYIAGALTAGAQTVVESENPIPAVCSALVRPIIDASIYTEKTAFDRKRQKGWYYRWWSGRCHVVPYPDRWTCNESIETAWAEIIKKVAAGQLPTGSKYPKDKEITPADRKQAVRELCTLGPFIGLEWSKDNNRRCVHTDQLITWRTQLLDGIKDNPQPFRARIATVRSAVAAQLNCNTKPLR